MNPSIDSLKASDGTGNASVATVQSVRAALATTLVVDTVQGINDTFHATMGTPHTFVDPVTSETITVISEDSAVDFRGHVDGTNLEIDEIAPGYTDNGSSVDDIVIIKPTTQWADMVAELLEVSLEDDGALKEQAVLDALGLTNPANGWTPLGATPDTVVYNGNRSYTLTFNSTDLTDTLSPGMRLRTTRTVTAPTQCADLEASSSQYFSRASGSLTGMTFTDDFVVSAWVKVESYDNLKIVSRYNGTSGWDFSMASDGRFQLLGYNGGASNVRSILSYQSLPLNKWVHVTAQLDMSTATTTPTTNYMMVDGVDIPCVIGTGGTSPTSLIQAGNLEIGGRNGGLQSFDGKIAQVAIYGAKVTQANIRATISQGLTGSETSLVAAYSLNNSLNDLSPNGNDLTAQNLATATNADSPFALGADLASGFTDGTTDFAVVMKSAYDGSDTTLTVQVPEGCTIPTSGGVSGVLYSTQDTPYGFPKDTNRWTVLSKYKTQTNVNGTTTLAQYAGQQLTVPVGRWNLRASFYVFNVSNAAGHTTKYGISTSTSSFTEDEMIALVTTSVSSQGAETTASLEKHIETSSATPYYMVQQNGNVNVTSGLSGSLAQAVVIEVENAYI